MSVADGRDVDVATLADLLRETEQHHGAFEASTGPHNWADWYAPYLRARLEGRTPDEATQAADDHMESVFHVVRH